jgi:Protein of unknown function (DUF3047)
MNRNLMTFAVVISCVYLIFSQMSAHAEVPAFQIRFSDEPNAPLILPQQLSKAESGNEINPQKKVKNWFKQHGWKGAYPPFAGTNERFWFAGPPGQRYLRIHAQNDFFIFVHQLDHPVNLQTHPIFEIVWAVDTFPQNASMGVYNRHDRAVVVVISFGDKVSGNLKNVPRGLAFYWGENDEVGRSYTCIAPAGAPSGHQQACTYPHVKYIPLQQGDGGKVKYNRINLVETFTTHFFDYVQQHGMPPMTAISIESRSDLTHSTASARLYSITLDAQP